MVQKNLHNTQAVVWCWRRSNSWSTHQLGLNEVAHDLVVEVINGTPLDSFLNVLFLHRWKTQRSLHGFQGMGERRHTLSHIIDGWTLGSGQWSHLLGLKRELDEDLLQLLIDKVDAKLLKAVSLEDRSNMPNIFIPPNLILLSGGGGVCVRARVRGWVCTLMCTLKISKP